MRARNLKPGLFKNELLAVADPLHTVIFEGLWCLADREGRLQDRPAKIHLEVNPGRPFDGTCASLDWLTANEFIHRYQADGAKFIQILTFWKHQKPHQNEAPSEIPAPNFAPRHEEIGSKDASTVDLGAKDLALIPSSLTPDSPFPVVGTRAASPAVPDEGKRKGDRGTRIQTPFPVTDAMRAWARQETPNVDVKAATAEFEDYWAALPGPKGRKLDWERTWRSRMREMQARTRRVNGYGQQQPPPKRERAPTPDEVAAARRRAAEENAAQVERLGLAGALKRV